ncbi:hypothetical protein ACFYKX_10185 [Cytobacillus sp. FJAT-54145]|uniref:Uncharacterized protein n=1 Tax=Cytobacillus spartinae TaxID=3299023 RepID=A0ABW6KCK9_9BACI
MKFSKMHVLKPLELITGQKEDPCVSLYPLDDAQIRMVVTAPHLTLRLIVPVLEPLSSPLHLSLSSLKKALGKTKAKDPVLFKGVSLSQEAFEMEVEKKEPYPVLSGTLTQEEINGKKWGSLLKPLPMFGKKDLMMPWVNQIMVKTSSEGVTLSACNGVHLVQHALYQPSRESSFFLEKPVLDVFQKGLSLFTEGWRLEVEHGLGFMKSPEESLVVSGVPAAFPNFSVPDPLELFALHVNPIPNGKSAIPWEKKFLDHLREIRDGAECEYQDLALRFEVKPGDPNLVKPVVILSDGKEVDSVETTSPFVMGVAPSILLPAYEVGKAMGLMETIDQWHMTDRGLLLASIQMDGILMETKIFLHGKHEKNA